MSARARHINSFNHKPRIQKLKNYQIVLVFKALAEHVESLKPFCGETEKLPDNRCPQLVIETTRRLNFYCLGNVPE